MKYIIKFTIFTIFTLVTITMRAQMVGLESDSKYMELIEKEANLKLKVDSIQNEVTKVRQVFNAEPSKRKIYAKQILQLEDLLFDVRRQLGSTANQTSMIEQEFIIANMNNKTQNTLPNNDTIKSIGNDKTIISNNAIFSKNLNANDYTTLKKSQDKENSIEKYIEIYNTNYNTISQIATIYPTETDVIVADSLYIKYIHLTTLNKVIEDTISSIWGEIYDNKTYYYNLLLDKQNKTSELETLQVKLSLKGHKEMQIEGRYQSDILAKYSINKRMILENEILIAKTFNLKAAQDSLTGAQTKLLKFNYNLDKIDIQKRQFIDYQNIKLASKSPYNSSNPIKSYKLSPRGELYMLKVGAYKAKQLPSIFRGASPICYIGGTNKNRLYTYYIGKFPYIDDAIDGVKQLKKRGFRDPIIKGWKDGVEIKVDMDAEMGKEGYAYRIQIDINGSLPQEIAQIIKTSSGNKEISKIGNSYTIGLFNSKSAAQRVIEMIKNTEYANDMNITISEIKL